MDAMIAIFDRLHAAPPSEQLAIIREPCVLDITYKALIRALCVCFALQDTPNGMVLTERTSETDLLLIAELTRPCIFLTAFVVDKCRRGDAMLEFTARDMLLQFERICRMYTSDSIVEAHEILRFPACVRRFYDTFDQATTRSCLDPKERNGYAIDTYLATLQRGCQRFPAAETLARELSRHAVSASIEMHSLT